MIVVDDLRPQLGCYGNALVQSPNIDRLATEGIVFKKSFCNIPVCGASRASLLTSTRPTRHRYLNHLSRADQQNPSAIPISQHFKNNGYQTISNGKVFHFKEDHADSWDEIWREHNNKNWMNYQSQVNQEIEKKHRRGPAFEALDISDTAYYDGRLALKTIDDLKKLKASGDPFFLASGFVKPHLPFNAPQRYWDLYDRSDFQPASSELWPGNAPKEAFHNFVELRNYHGIPKDGPINDSLSVTLQHGYHACISYIDQQIGLVLNALDELEMRENTIVILWGDHGWNLGEHGLWCKHCNFKNALSAPLIISAPGMPKNAVARSVTEFIDVYPTLSELCGLEIPSTVRGESLVVLMKDPGQSSPNDFAISKWSDGLTISTELFGYTEWRKENDSLVSRMLFDHTLDPDETNNLSNDPGYNGLMDSLSQLMLSNRGAEYFVDTSVKKVK